MIIPLLLVCICGLSQQLYYKMKVTQTGECYFDQNLKKMQTRNLHGCQISVAYDMKASNYGRFTITSTASYDNITLSYDLLSLLKSEDPFFYYSARDNKGNNIQVIKINHYYEGSVGYYIVDRVEIFVFDNEGNGEYYDCKLED